MTWFNRLALPAKISTACYLVAALFAVPVFMVFVVMGKWLIGLLLVLILLALTYPLSLVLKKSLIGSFDDIVSMSAKIAKGDFTGNISDTAGMEGLSRSFNSMVDKLRNILKETSEITSKVMNSSRSISERNQELITVMTQVGQSSNELATGAGVISDDISCMTESIGQIEAKVCNYTESTR